MSASLNAVQRILGADPNRKRGVVMTLDEPVVICNSQGSANDSRNAANAAGLSARGFVLPVNVAQGNASISKDGEPYPVPGAFDHSAMAALSPDGTMLAASVSFGYGTYLYDPATSKRIATLTDPGSQFPGSGVFSPDGTMLAVIDDDPNGDQGHVDLWDVTRNRR